jgi:hypothetical protein
LCRLQNDSSASLFFVDPPFAASDALGARVPSFFVAAATFTITALAVVVDMSPTTPGRRRQRVVILRARASTRARRGARAAGERRFAFARLAPRARWTDSFARVRVVECDGERDATRRRRKTARAAPRAMTKPSRERARASKATPAASARGVGATTTTTKAKAKATRAADGGRGDGAARDDAKRGRDARASGEEGAKANDDDGFDVDALFGDAKKRAVKMNSGAREAAAAAEAPRVRVLLPGQKKPKQKRDKPEFTPVDKPRRYEDGLPVYKSYGDFSDMKAGQCDDGNGKKRGPNGEPGGDCPFDCWCCF